jgi:Gly-Xaa carboxypeptidase
MKGEYSPLPTSEPPSEHRDDIVQPRTVWKRALPFLALFAVVAVLAAMNPMGCKDHGKALKGLKVPGYAHLPASEMDPFALDDEHHHRRPHHAHKGHKEHHEYTSATLAAALKEASCPAQPAPLNVGPAWDPEADEEFARKAAERLSKAVQINTVSTDDLPADPTDPRFDGHYKFAEYLESEYPSIYEHLDHEIVNTHAHLFTWKGADEGLKPIFLMAHVDTVPVNPDTVDQWTYPPWSGEVTHDATAETPGTWIWGRGASDCKNSLVGILHAVEKLVGEGFTPGRTVLIGYGFDEEIGGARGALKIKEVVEERYGEDGIAFIIDEGFSGVAEDYGIPIASLGMAEKGSVSVKLTIDTPGGHSSVPPVHTGSE